MSDSSDEEYGLLATTWGSQDAGTAANNDNTVIIPPFEIQKNDASKDNWDSLLDPNFKAGPNDLGNGNLHRRGANFKPVGEDLILAQRLKIQLPKNKMKEAIRETEIALGLSPSKNKGLRNNKKKSSNSMNTTGLRPSVSNGDMSRFSHKPNNSTAPAPNRSYQNKSTITVPSTIRSPPVSTPNGNLEGSKWSQTVLMDTPFWEQKQSANVENENESDSSMSSWARPEPALAPLKKQLKPVDNAWEKLKNKNNAMMDDKMGGWGSKSTASNRDYNGWETNDDKSTKSVLDNGWNSEEIEKGWSAAEKELTKPIAGWGEVDADVDTIANITNTLPLSDVKNNGKSHEKIQSNDIYTNNIPLSRTPSWLNSIPSASNNNNHTSPEQSQHQHVQHQYSQQQQRSTRFSDRAKARYSETIPHEMPKPINYRSDGREPLTPTAIAPPPPPENKLLITINVELSDTLKLPVDVYELDDPAQLAMQFAKNNNIDQPKIVAALTSLFFNQKETALKKRDSRLQHSRQQFSRTTSNQTHFNNIHTKPAYNSSLTLNSPPPIPFARKVYY